MGKETATTASRNGSSATGRGVCSIGTVIGDGGYVAVAEQETLMAYNKRNHNPPVFGWSNRGEGKACSCPVATKFEMKGKTGDSSEDWTERQEKEKERRK